MTKSAINSANRLSSRAVPSHASRGMDPDAPVSSFLTDYEFLSLAGRGTFSEVWQVREKPTGRIVALKQLIPEWAEQRSARQLLENEAEIGRQVRSPYVVRVLGSQMAVTPQFTILEWLDGSSLESLLEREPQLSEIRSLWIARQCAEGLRDLHDAGYSHGDLKPANICILADGRLKLIDLGFARPVTTGAADRANRQSAQLVGTPEYLAPEMLAAGGHDGAAKDAYSLGVVLYRLLAGRLPFQGETLPEILRQQQRSVAAPLRTAAPHVSQVTAEIVERLLSKQPLRRGARWQDLVRELITLEIAAI